MANNMELDSLPSGALNADVLALIGDELSLLPSPTPPPSSPTSLAHQTSNLVISSEQEQEEEVVAPRDPRFRALIPPPEITSTLPSNYIINNLNSDLLNMIFSLLPTSSLLSSALVCKSWTLEATSLIWKSIFIGSWEKGRKLSWSDGFKKFKTKELWLSDYPESGMGGLGRGVGATLVGQAGMRGLRKLTLEGCTFDFETLRGLPSLTTLIIRNSHSLDANTGMKASPSLTRLSLTNYSSESAFPFSFFSTPSLTHLTISSLPSSLLTTLALEDLRSLQLSTSPQLLSLSLHLPSHLQLPPLHILAFSFLSRLTSIHLRVAYRVLVGILRQLWNVRVETVVMDLKELHWFLLRQLCEELVDLGKENKRHMVGDLECLGIVGIGKEEWEEQGGKKVGKMFEERFAEVRFVGRFDEWLEKLFV